MMLKSCGEKAAISVIIALAFFLLAVTAQATSDLSSTVSNSDRIGNEISAKYSTGVTYGGDSIDPSTGKHTIRIGGSNLGSSASIGSGASASVGSGASASVGSGASASVGSGASASVGSGASASVGSGDLNSKKHTKKHKSNIEAPQSKTSRIKAEIFGPENNVISQSTLNDWQISRKSATNITAEKLGKIPDWPL
jgi:hypothetical protein